jgi:G:T/U-mismatch repair DNA glycosylase
MNDDVNTYLSQGKIGKLFFQIATVNVVQLQTQSNAGGNTEAYKAYGTYVKSFYSVIAAPDCCKIAYMGTSHRRLHHKINWNHAVPMILDEKHRKQRAA